MSKTGRGGSPSSGFIKASISSDLYMQRQANGDARDADEDYTNGTTKQQSAARYPNGPLINEPTEGQDQEYANAGGDASADSTLHVVRDLRKSGLHPRDMLVRVLGDPEKAACGIPGRGEGYAIPYFDPAGVPIPFYRSRILNPDYATNGVKYKQPRNTTNHIYFPRNFRDTLNKHIQRTRRNRLVIITEGEKKAAACQKLTNIPSVAFGGVDSWRSRTIQLPPGTEVYSTTQQGGADQSKKGPIIAKLPSSDVSIPELLNLAKGFGDLLDLIQQYDLHPIVIYDSDHLGTIKAEVQRAATMLAYELVFLGVHARNIKQVILPALPREAGEDEPETQEEAKTGLDDFLMSVGPDPLLKLIEEALQDPKAFPRHPNPKGFISTQLQSNRLSRKALQQVASMVLTELDASGKRLRSQTTQELYYYDQETHHLLPALKTEGAGRLKVPEGFGTLLYQRYGISKLADQKVLEWLEAQFLGEEPIEDVNPKRIISLITEAEDPLNPHGVAIQASDSQFFAVSPDPLHPVILLDNGSKGILFEQGHVEPLDVDLVLEHLDHQLAEAEHNNGLLEPWWQHVISESNIGLEIETPNDGEGFESQDVSGEGFHYILTEGGKSSRQYATLLFYISPFLLRWRGLQLPVELTIGSAGSGKSSLYSLRLQILTGRSKLRNIPADIRDFQSSLANAGGLHVTDNVNFADKALRQTISDELCRITTERIPEISTRRYYTNTEELRIPVHCTFAFTALSLPFLNEDLLQRAVTFHTKNVGREPRGDWFEEKLNERGGREAWFAHHLAFLHLFLKYPFSDHYYTQHRLAHLEQSMHIASQVLGVNFNQPTLADSPADSFSPSSLPLVKAPAIEGGTVSVNRGLSQVIRQSQANQIVEGDWVMRGISAYVSLLRTQNDLKKKIFAGDIVEFALQADEFSDCEVLINPRRLGRYMQEHAVQMSQTIGIRSAGTYGNKAFFLITEG